MPRTTGRPLTPTEAAALGAAIRKNALDQMAAGLRSAGIDQAEIDETRKKCEAVDSDQPLVDLFKSRRQLLR